MYELEYQDQTTGTWWPLATLFDAHAASIRAQQWCECYGTTCRYYDRAAQQDAITVRNES